MPNNSYQVGATATDTRIALVIRNGNNYELKVADRSFNRISSEEVSISFPGTVRSLAYLDGFWLIPDRETLKFFSATTGAEETLRRITAPNTIYGVAVENAVIYVVYRVSASSKRIQRYSHTGETIGDPTTLSLGDFVGFALTPTDYVFIQPTPSAFLLQFFNRSTLSINNVSLGIFASGTNPNGVFALL